MAFTTRPELTGTFGMVAATHWLGAQTGMRVLEAGGNAFDAAAATGLVLEVVEPHLNGIGGEVPVIAYSATDDDVVVICGQGVAPASATPRAFTDLGLDLVPGAGLLAACVPGAFGGWMLLLERYGTMPLREIMEPAIGYAADGFPALPSLCRVIASMEPTFRELWPGSAAIWLANGVPTPGERLRNAELAVTLSRLLEAGEAAGTDRLRQIEGARAAFYEGFVAEAIDSFCATPQPSPAGAHRGLLAGDDLASWRATIEAPVTMAYGDFEVMKTGPWGQGPVMLAQLALLSGFDLRALGAGSPELVHLVAECAKLAFADREAWYGDPRFAEVPLEDLLSPAYNDERRRLVGDEASLELRPGAPGGRTPRLPRLALDDEVWERAARAAGAEIGRGADASLSGAVPTAEPTRLASAAEVTGSGRGDTVHLDVADRFGNLVSCTPSGGWLQSSPAIPGLGFCLGTRGQMFWLEEGLASTLRPGSRPRTTLSPSLAFRDGRPYMVFGTPGGDQQDQWPLRVFLYHADLGLPLQAAVDTASFDSGHFPSSFFPREFTPGELHAEPALGAATLSELSRRGHRVLQSGEWALGRCTAVARTPDGLLHAAADPRSGQAYAVGR
ncbi:MAG TPA: gamma-glutamyltransferase family protein [Acidimicrobiales bacterium]|nr:gamma-glutamyltransferase family protein [Acidimicrobiales bacterium]